MNLNAFGFCGATLDSRLVKPGMLYVALKGEHADGNDYIPNARAAGAAKILGGPTALADLQALARDYRRSLRAKVIGVTGSAGKTTTKEILRAFLSRIGKVHATEGNFNNHLGLPLTILNCPEDADFLVIEMGTNHPGEIARLCEIAEPDAGLITNVGTAHLEFFGSQDGIAAEKGTLFARVREFAVVSSENVRLGKLRELCRAELVVVDPHQAWMAAALEGVLPGAHNVSNACLAFAAAERFGATRADALAALSDFRLPGARWRRVERCGVSFVDDSYNANPDSMIAALDAFAKMPCAGRRIAVLGDMGELGPESAAFHRRVFDHAAELGFPLVFGFGPLSARCRCDVAARTMDELIGRFRAAVAPGDLVLLKASHSMNLSKLIDSL